MTLPFIRPLWGCHLQLHVELSGEKSSSVLFSRGGGGGKGASVAFVKRGLGNKALFFHLQQGQIKVTLTVTGSFASTPSLIALWHNCFFACRKSVTSEQREQAREMKKNGTNCAYRLPTAHSILQMERETLLMKPIQDPKYSLSGQVGMPPSLRRRFTDSKKTFETQKNLPRCKKIAVINLYHCFPPVSFFTPLIPQIPSRQFTWLQRVYPNVNKETWKRSQIKFYYIADSACGQ